MSLLGNMFLLSQKMLLLFYYRTAEERNLKQPPLKLAKAHITHNPPGYVYRLLYTIYERNQKKLKVVIWVHTIYLCAQSQSRRQRSTLHT